jgi:hypothetical protein
MDVLLLFAQEYKILGRLLYNDPWFISKFLIAAWSIVHTTT